MQGFRHQLQEQYSIVQGDNQDLDEIKSLVPL